MSVQESLAEPRATGSARGYDSDSFSSVAERTARFLGTGRYLAGQTVVVLAWCAINVAAGRHGLWDRYPFKALNLVFSTQAAYAAPLILLAENRQDDRDRDELERDRLTKARAVASTEFLAREIADLRLTLGTKIDRDEIALPIDRLTQAIERLTGQVL